jgi:hypothetical protein
LLTDIRIGASLIRLHFHDCFVNVFLCVFINFEPIYFGFLLRKPPQSLTVGKKNHCLNYCQQVLVQITSSLFVRVKWRGGIENSKSYLTRLSHVCIKCFSHTYNMWVSLVCEVHQIWESFQKMVSWDIFLCEFIWHLVHNSSLSLT